MATININRSAATILSPQINDSSKRYKMLNGADYVVLNFKHDSFVEFFPGDYVTWDGETYSIDEVPKFKKKSERHYEYELRFEGPYKALDKAMFLLDDAEGVFPLTGKAEDFIDLAVSNLNRVHGAGSYSTGTVPSTDFKNLEFNNETCLNVLQRICQEYELEYYFSGSGVINLSSAIGVSTGLSYEYADGLKNITRSKISDKDLITRLYAYGSEKNIASTYGTKRLHLPSGTYPNFYAQQNTATYGIREAVKHWDDIYPHFDGVVDSSPTSNIILDAAIDFDLNSYLIEGVVAKIVFRSGDLAGMEFEISEYNNSTHQVTFNAYTDEAGGIYPSATFNPSVGDEYTFVDILMPAAYITAAEAELATAALAYLGDLSAPNVAYEVEVDWHHLSGTSTTMDVGDLVEITDADLAVGGINYRILQLEQSIANPYKYSIKTGEFILTSYISRVNTARADLTREVIAVRRDNVRDTRRGYLAITELQGSIFDNDGYFDPENIKPLSIETSMLTVGNKSTQLTLSGVLAEPNYQGNNNYLEISTGSLIHFTLEAAARTWDIASYSTTTLSTSSAYYMYVRCPKVGSSATWIVTTDEYQVDPDDGYYYFLVGFLSSVIDDLRRISWLYGQTAINGGFIRTGRISSISGATYFDLDTGDIVGTITFGSGSSGYANLSDRPTSLGDINSTDAANLATALSTASSAQGDATQALADAAAAQSTADGSIICYYQDTEPTEGTEGDIWFDTNDGNKIYVYDSGAWVESQDNDIATAINNAQNAQSTADGKALVFYQDTAPATGMSARDLWVDTNAGNRTYIYSGSSWVATSTVDAINALANAATAQATADGKIQTYYQASVPGSGGEGVGDLWFDTDDGNKPYIYRAAQWLENSHAVFRQTWAPSSGMVSGDFWIDTDGGNAVDIYNCSWGLYSSVTYLQDTQPTSGLVTGDLWVDTDGGNAVYRYDSSTGWVAYSVNTFFQDTEPTEGMADDDLWFDTSDSFETYQCSGSWGNFSDSVYIQTSAPSSGMTAGDVWFDSDDGYQPYIYHAIGWADNQDTALAQIIDDMAGVEATLDGKVTTFYAASTQPPIAEGVGDLWYQTDTGKLIRWNGSSWGQDVADTTQTVIDGGLITTGRLVVKNSTTEQGGITGYTGTGSTQIGLWLGATYAGRASAPFRVTHAGAVTMTNATVQSSATGERVVIDSSDNSIKWYNSSNNLKMEISASTSGGNNGMWAADATILIQDTGHTSTNTDLAGGYISMSSTDAAALNMGYLYSAKVTSGSSQTFSVYNLTTSTSATGNYQALRGNSEVRYANQNIGVYGYGHGSSSTQNMGVYGIAAGGTTAYGIYGYASGASTNWAGYFQGNVNVTSNIYCSNVHATTLYLNSHTPTTRSYRLVTNNGSDEAVSIESDASDIRFKDKRKAITNPTEKLLGLNGITFQFNKLGNRITGQSMKGRRASVIAQDLLKVLPEGVMEIADTGYYDIDDRAVCALLVEGFKERHNYTMALEKRIVDLEKIIAQSTNKTKIK